MSNKYEFEIRVSVDDSLNEDDTAEVLQRVMSQVQDKHSDFNYATVLYSPMEESERERLFDMLTQFDEADIEDAVSSVDELSDDE